MELRQLVYFEAVARCGGFTRAADDLRIAQPAISAQIRRLEHELGITLIARTSRRVALTEAGELLLVRARRVLGELDAARDDMREVAAVLRGRVVLGTTGVLGGIDLPAALASFARRYPGVTLSVRSGLVASLLVDLGGGELDLVLGPLHDHLPPAMTAERLVDDRLVLIGPPGHLPRRGPVALADLRDEPFVCLPTGSGLRDLLFRVTREAGFDVHLRFEAPDPDGVRAMVAAGLGVALMAVSAIERPGAPVDVHDLEPAIAHPPFRIVRLADQALSPAAAALHRHVVAAARGPAAG